MEFAVYRIYYRGDRRTGTLVNMFSSRGEAEAYAQTLGDDHEVVGLMTREITVEDSGLWDTVVFAEGGVEPYQAADTGGKE